MIEGTSSHEKPKLKISSIFALCRSFSLKVDNPFMSLAIDLVLPKNIKSLQILCLKLHQPP